MKRNLVILVIILSVLACIALLIWLVLLWYSKMTTVEETAV